MIPIKLITHYSVLKAYNKDFEKLIKVAAEAKIPALPITDFHTVSGVVDFMNTLTKSKSGIRPLIGCQVRIHEIDGTYYYVTLFCKNKDGWYSLIKILGESRIDNEILSIDRNKLLEHSAGLILIIGGVDSPLMIWSQQEEFWQSLMSAYDNRFFLLKESLTHPNQANLNDKVDELKLPYLEGNPVYYPLANDDIYQHIIVCSRNKITLKEHSENKSEDNYDNVFFNTKLNLLNHYSEQNSKLLDMIEPFELKGKPHIPQPRIPKEYKDADDYLICLCREGWKAKFPKGSLDPELEKIYVARIKMELEVFTKAKLAGYMLIIRLVTEFCHKHKYSVGLRGSAVGCLVSYLIGISDVDPLRPDPTLPYHPDRALLFERFYSDARNTETHVSLPDVDLDCPISARGKIIQYFKEVYGADAVSNIVTFGRLDGRGTMKEIFRVLQPCDNAFEIANKLSKEMLDTAKVQDVLEELKEENPEYNIINYNIDHVPYVHELAQEFKNEFEIAKNLTGLINKQSRHAAGIVITNGPMKNHFPITFDPKNGDMILSLEMEDAENCGCVKMDILGVAAYEKLDKIREMLELGLDEPIVGLDDDFTEEF